MRKVIFATGNANKIREIREVLGINAIQVIGMAELGYDREIAETGNSLEENAIIKANAIYEKFGTPCIAEDSGLEVVALNGQPGVRSARYAGAEADSDTNMTLLLDRLKGMADRRARFRAVIAYRDHNNTLLFDGIVSGNILESRSGEQGFGYDPLFVPDGFCQSFGELGMAVKKRISHRTKAWGKCLPFLLQKP